MPKTYYPLTSKAGHRSTLRFCVIRSNWKTQAHTDQLGALGRKRIHFHGNRRPNAGVEHALLEQLMFLSNARIVLEDVDTQVDFTSPRKSADKMQTIARKRWYGAKNLWPA